MKVEELKKKISTLQLKDFLLLNKEQEKKGIIFIDGEHEDRKITYAQLYRKAAELADEIDDRDKNGNGYFIILAQGHESFIRSFWGIVLSGRKAVISPVLTDFEDIMEFLHKQISSLENCYIVTTSQFVPLVEKMLESERIINIDTLSKDSYVISDRVYKVKKPKDVSIIQFSSGSISHPKGGMLSDFNITNNIYQLLARLRYTDMDSSINYLPLNHSLGLLALVIAPMCLEVDQYHIETKSMLQNPLILLERIDKYRVTTTASPNIGLKYMMGAMRSIKDKKLDLSSIRVFILGAEPLSWELIEEFFSVMQRYKLAKEAAVTAYGMTEAGLAISVPKDGTTPKCIWLKNSTMPGLGEKVAYFHSENESNNVLRSSVSLGYALDGLSLRICDGEDNVCQNGISGEIEIKGPNVFLGYINGNEKTFSKDDWFKTGDIGALIDDRLYIFGRLKNMIIANGSNIYLEDIESYLTKKLNIEQGKIAVSKSNNLKFDNAISVYFEKGSFGDRSFEGISDEAKKNVQSTFGIIVDSVYTVDQLPRTAIGKIARGKLLLCERSARKENRNLKDDLKVKLHGSREDIKEAIITLIDEETGILIDNPNIGFLDAGLDSLKLNVLVEELKAFYTDIKISDLFEASTVNKLCEMLLNLNNRVKLVEEKENNKEKIALLFPGQGALNKESCEKLYRSFDVARNVFDEASEILEHDVIKDFRQGQPELLAASIAAYKVLESYTGITPKYMAGHSLGEYSALCAADVIDFKTALKLTRIREMLMKKARTGIMVAVLGIDQTYIQHFIDDELKGKKVYCANFNSPKQVVISGVEEDVKFVMKELEACGANCIQLRTDSASHCPLMETVAAEYKLELENVDFNMNNSMVNVIANVNAEKYTSSNVISNLTDQLTSPVLWSQIVRKLVEQGVETFIDVGPGEVLKNINDHMGFRKEIKTYSEECDLEIIRELFNKSTIDMNLQINDIEKLFNKCLRVIICSPCKIDYQKDTYASLISEPVKEMVFEYKNYQEKGKLFKMVDGEEMIKKTIQIMGSKGFSPDYTMEFLKNTVLI